MSFSAELIQTLSATHLLKHPFYQEWNAGTISKETLELYAKQYYHHVAAFPRYISATHSNCCDIKSRQVLLENLIDEEQGENNHPELWMRFAESVGATRDGVKSEKLFASTERLIDTMMGFSKKSYAEGLGALFAYEQQVPEVAATKIEGLKKHYGVDSEKGLSFFKVHQAADVYHTEALIQMLEALTLEEKVMAAKAAEKASLALWGFLDGIQGGSQRASA